MRVFVAKRHDGGVDVSAVLPTVFVDGGEVYWIDRILREGGVYHLTVRPGDGDTPLMATVPVQSEALGYPRFEDMVAQWVPETRLAVVSWREMSPDAVPKDASFRGAWCDVTPEPVIDIDMARAREIHRLRLRAMRAPKLAALDTEYMRADEAGNSALKRDIALQKQALRDVTKDPAIGAARTPDELKAVTPAALR